MPLIIIWHQIVLNRPDFILYFNRFAIFFFFQDSSPENILNSGKSLETLLPS